MFRVLSERFMGVRKKFANAYTPALRPGGRKVAHGARSVGLATTSTRNDDVALEVENAANGNLIHAVSSVRVKRFPYSEGPCEYPQGNPYALAGPFGGLLASAP